MVGAGVRIRKKESPSPSDPPQLTFPEHPPNKKKGWELREVERSPVPWGRRPLALGFRRGRSPQKECEATLKKGTSVAGFSFGPFGLLFAAVRFRC